MTAGYYVDEILTRVVLLMLSSSPGAIYQEENDRPHTARFSQQCLQGYDVLPQPARSPDLSTTEHVWDMLGRQMHPSEILNDRRLALLTGPNPGADELSPITFLVEGPLIRLIKLGVTPVDLQISSNYQQPFIAGKQVSLFCRSHGSHPRAHLSWHRKGSLIVSKEVISDNGNVTTGYLLLNMTPEDDGDVIQCFAVNPSAPDYILVTNYTMIVHYKPEINLAVLHSGKRRFAQGYNITIRCSVRANPRISRMTWMRNGIELHSSSSVYLYNTTLQITNISVAHAGKYTCIAVNREGQTRSSTNIEVA
ncbi:hemicentin-1-like, partial [Stegodyphus dumicola]|uniref:hemicentin-1-like n=1 Tax=Stegodyphus dumicola TaxID=202533 RepID=UPI0015A77B77